jgi:hypothetical protein
MKAQVTLYDKSGKYRPVSCLIPIDSKEDFAENKDKIKSKGIRKIMIQRGWTKKDLITYNYLTCKMRINEEEK